MIGHINRLVLIAITYLGAFSRFTHGKHTPAFYRYQVDRAPDNESTAYIAYVDIFVGTMLLSSRTKTLGTLLSAAAQGIGVWKRVDEEKPAAVDLLLFSVAATALVYSVMGWS